LVLVTEMSFGLRDCDTVVQIERHTVLINHHKSLLITSFLSLPPNYDFPVMIPAANYEKANSKTFAANYNLAELYFTDLDSSISSLKHWNLLFHRATQVKNQVVLGSPSMLQTLSQFIQMNILLYFLKKSLYSYPILILEELN